MADPGAGANEQASFRFSGPLRVCWAEPDAQEVVFGGPHLLHVDV